MTVKSNKPHFYCAITLFWGFNMGSLYWPSGVKSDFQETRQFPQVSPCSTIGGPYRDHNIIIKVDCRSKLDITGNLESRTKKIFHDRNWSNGKVCVKTVAFIVQCWHSANHQRPVSLFVRSTYSNLIFGEELAWAANIFFVLLLKNKDYRCYWCSL